MSTQNFYENVSLNERLFNGNEIIKKSMQTMLGLCTGIMADGKVSEEEFHFFHQWMLENYDARNDWPGSFLFEKINEILEDDLVEPHELKEFEGILSELIGGTLQETGTTQGNSTTLPLDKDAIIVIPEKRFCFTGQFLYGQRKDCEKTIIELGGLTEKRVVKKLDYLVIGNLVAPAWVNTSYGRKIEKALEYKEAGCDLSIISEDAWVQMVS